MDNNTKSEFLQKQYKRLKVSQTLAREFTGHSVKSCCRSVKSHSVQVKLNSAGQAYYYGLFKCGSVWDCPHCAGIISSNRRDEIENAINKWRLQGGKVKLITYTVRHNLGDDLKSVMFALSEAYRFSKSGAPYQRIKSRYGIKGSIVATEVNYGEFGWHYHRHEILFYKSDLDFDKLSGFIYDRYNGKLRELGFNSLEGIGVNVSKGEGQLSSYLSKWGLENELTSIKDSQSKTPFQLLDDDKDYFAFVEYSRSMHGKKRLTWSAGLKNYFDIVEVKDEELLEADQTEVDQVIRVISYDEWKIILKLNLYTELLLRAESDKNDFDVWYRKKVCNIPLNL